MEGEAMTATTGDGGKGRGNRWRIIGWGAAALMLLFPLVAMRLTGEVNWDAADFLFMAVLLGGVGLGFELAVARTRDVAYRTAAGIALAAAFLLVWINAAVGIIGSENNAANLMYGGVLTVALLGAIVARFRPLGMARAMIAAALAQLLVPAIASATTASARSPEVLVLTGFFATTWLLSAWLFRKAAARQNGADEAH
jgi:hypothetical protein